MGYEASKVPPDNAMPCGALALVKRALDVLGNVLPSIVLATRIVIFGKRHFFRTFSIVNFAIAS